MERSLTSPLIGVHDKKGGWSSSVYLIGAQIMERFAMLGASGNLIMYLTNVLHEPTATAAKNVSVFNGVAMLLPLLGAFVADAYLGRHKTILISSLVYVMGLVALILSVWIIPLESRYVPFYLSLYLVAIGHGGHQPCLQTFGADQFNENNLEEKKAKSAFFNWWFFGIAVGASTGMLIVFYIQENVGWAEGFAIPAIAMAMGSIVYLLGGKSYRQHVPRGSPLTRIIQVFVAAFHKRHLCLSKDDSMECSEEEGNVAVRIQDSVQTFPPTRQFTWLDKAAIVDDIDAISKTKDNWRLCTVTQVEEVKSLLCLVPIWLSCLMYAVIFTQGSTFFTKQGSTMDTSIGNDFHMSPASLQVFTGLAIVLFVPIYDKIFIPTARSFTGYRSGITMLQRIGFGMFLATVSMIVAALVETTRIRIASEHGLLDQQNTMVPMRVWWLLPQYGISGVSSVFTIVGLQELFYDQIPNEMRSIGSAMQLSTFGVGNLLSGFVICAVQYISLWAGDEWLVDNLNRAHLDYYYWLLAGLCTFALCGFIGGTKGFVYKKVDGRCATLL